MTKLRSLFVKMFRHILVLCSVFAFCICNTDNDIRKAENCTTLDDNFRILGIYHLGDLNFSFNVSSPKIQFQGKPIDGENHNVISAYTLRDFHNGMIRSHINDYIAFTVRLIRYEVCKPGYLSEKSTNLSSFNTELRNGCNNSFSAKIWKNLCPADRSTILELLHSYGKYVLTMILEMPFNLVNGPKRRCDDPGQYFDENLQSIVDPEIFQDLRKLNEAMVAGKFDSASDLLTQMLDKDSTPRQPKAYSEDDWKYDKSRDCYTVNNHRESDLNNPMCLQTIPVKEPYVKGKMSCRTDHGQWASFYSPTFPFYIEGKIFFYGQNTVGKNWVIRELFSNGTMGDKTDTGYWNASFEVQFPFSIQGKTFFFGQNFESAHSFIRELLPNGKMGNETDHYHWKHIYHVQFPFSIHGRTYFYGHNILKKSWFIRELLPNGKMGALMSLSHWDLSYPAQFPYSIGGRTFFYGQNMEQKRWFVQELLPDGRMGEETDKGSWGEAYRIQFPFYLNSEPYFYRHDTSSKKWFIQKLMPDGKMGPKFDNGFWSDSYENQFPFSTFDGRQFIYGQTSVCESWFIQEII